jgi:hypothetical protein
MNPNGARPFGFASRDYEPPTQEKGRVTRQKNTFPAGSLSGCSPRLSHLLLAFLLASALLALIPSAALAAGSAVTNPAAKPHHTTVVLNGHLDPEGDPGITDCYFEWGSTTAYGNVVPCAEGTAFGAPTDVSALVSGLSPASIYHFRLHIETTSPIRASGPYRSPASIR